jgi:hypothetical protein
VECRVNLYGFAGSDLSLDSLETAKELTFRRFPIPETVLVREGIETYVCPRPDTVLVREAVEIYILPRPATVLVKEGTET